MIKTAEIFGDYMVLQRQKPVAVWGSCDGEENVEAFWNDASAGMCDVSDGVFRLELAPMEAACDGTLCLRGSSGAQVVFTHVDVGEVWIAGGQSNMEFLLAYDVRGEEMAAAASDAHFRFFDVGEYAFSGEREDGFKDNSHWERWMTFTPEDAPYFSAVGTYFAQRLRGELDVPVGIVGCNWGGTTASAWTDERILREDDVLRIYTDAYDKATANLNPEKYRKKNRELRQRSSGPQVAEQMRKMMKAESTEAPGLAMRFMSQMFAKMNPMGPHSENRPGGLYQTMVKPIAGYGARGVIWYQGESDDEHAECYARLFAKMIACWRDAWKDNLPFFFVQLAPFDAWMGSTGVRYPILRQQQEEVARTVEGTYMASIMDAGSRYDIHPKDKRPAGERLAALALANIYGADCPCYAPQMKRVAFVDGLLTVEFDHTYGGLTLKDEEGYSSLPELFQVNCDGKEILVTARIEGDCIRLESPKITADGQIEVSFAYLPYCRMSLFGASGLPAKPFPPVVIA